ncbi:MAG: Ku protein [Methylovirgula sp.]|jgi:DNA end-binding protein Ku
MAPRANWKGFLKLGELTCPVALYTAVSTSERIAFHTINRETGHRVQRQFVDEDSGKPVPSEDQVKGYEVAQGQYVMFSPEEVAAAVPESDKILAVEAFVAINEIDDVYLDRPYYLSSSGVSAEEAFALLREGMRKKKVAALARAVLFRRVRTLLIRPDDKGLLATTLNFDYEVRSATEAFADIPEIKIDREMRDLAKHIIETKRGSFDPRTFDDRYEAAVAELVRAKQEGRVIELPKAQPATNVINLKDALRQSAALSAGGKTNKGKSRTAASASSKTSAKKASPKAASGARRRKEA